MSEQGIKAQPLPRRNHEHRATQRQGGDLRGPTLRIDAEVRLRQRHHGSRPALPRGGEIALDPARIQVGVQRGDHKGDVDIGGDDLQTPQAVGRPAHESRAARQDGMDGGGSFYQIQRERHPVADGGMACLPGLVKQAAGSLGPQLSLIGGDQVAIASLNDDAPGAVARARVWREGCRQQIGPTVLLDQIRPSQIADDDRQLAVNPLGLSGEGGSDPRVGAIVAPSNPNASVAGGNHDGGDRFAAGQRVPSRLDGGCDGFRHEFRRNLRGLQLRLAKPGLLARRKLQHSFTPPHLVTRRSPCRAALRGHWTTGRRNP